MRVPVQYYRLATDIGMECVESKFGYVHKELTLDVSETALVIVDPWDKHYIINWLKRANEITRTKIAPAVEAARNCGIKVIYAPSPGVALKYPQWTKFACDEEVNPLSSHPLDWPPPDFRQRTGRYAEYFPVPLSKEPAVINAKPYPNAINEIIRPKPEDFVIATGNQLERLLKYYRVLHLFYCGFAVNMCVQLRDYGMRAFASKGYNLILIRDATTGVEYHDTVDDLLATKTAIRDIETLLGWSTSTEDFVKACNNSV